MLCMLLNYAKRAGRKQILYWAPQQLGYVKSAINFKPELTRVT